MLSSKKSMILEMFWKQVKWDSFYLLPLKKENVYSSCKIYARDCSCKENYIGETERNVITRRNEHENPNKVSEPAK